MYTYERVLGGQNKWGLGRLTDMLHYFHKKKYIRNWHNFLCTHARLCFSEVLHFFQKWEWTPVLGVIELDKSGDSLTLWNY